MGIRYPSVLVALMIVNPISDVDFARRVEALAMTCPTPADLQLALRAYHPEAVVRARGLSGERESWYVYRDGRWVQS